MTRFIRTFKTYKLFHILRPSLKEVTHPTNIVPHALFKFKDTARYGVYALENGLIREKTLKYIVEYCFSNTETICFHSFHQRKITMLYQLFFRSTEKPVESKTEVDTLRLGGIMPECVLVG
ncbi:hypothetical protein RF11_10834 [Thelohanellus kitauei]|uniref:Uncharacterized protein n=1 Tax=Thelohanellus kitauei TaxID=669202 RepID=A0A0C2J429_THEKT|nr:hypothetical protein RF11_10834 [Thelohanellus kitauei]